MSSNNYRRGTRGTRRFINNTNNINQSRISQIRLINNTNAIDRIARAATLQLTNNSFEKNLFNGTSFHDNIGNLESLILPAGCSVSSSFPEINMY
jgi:hypothetical protein